MMTDDDMKRVHGSGNEEYVDVIPIARKPNIRLWLYGEQDFQRLLPLNLGQYVNHRRIRG